MQQYMLQIIEHLGEKGYKKLNPDSNNVYGRAEGDAIYVIVLGNSRNLKADNLIKFNSQIRNDLEETGKRVMILNLLLTKDGIFDDDLSTIIKKMDNVWLFSEDYGKLYIFENQPAYPVKENIWSGNTDSGIAQYFGIHSICIYQGCLRIFFS